MAPERWPTMPAYESLSQKYQMYATSRVVATRSMPAPIDRPSLFSMSSMPRKSTHESARPARLQHMPTTQQPTPSRVPSSEKAMHSTTATATLAFITPST
jgi:hypothetical protein